MERSDRQASTHPPRRHGGIAILAGTALVSIAVLLLLMRTSPTVKAYASGRVAVLAGTSGTVSTLACYDLPSPSRPHPLLGSSYNDPFPPCNMTDSNPHDGVTGPHLGTFSAPTDIQASSGSGVIVQLDYLPNDSNGVAGGYAIAYEQRTGCGSYDPTSAYWNGRKVEVDITHYNRLSQQLNGQSIMYEHVNPDNSVVGTNSGNATWFRWNNAYAYQMLWPPYAQQLLFNNTGLGGWSIATVAQPKSGAKDVGCSTGAHLHQDATSGEYNHSQWWSTSGGGTYATARVSDMQYVTMSGIIGTAPSNQ